MKRTIVVLTLLVLAFTRVALAADLRVTDSRGTEVLVTGAAIDYSGFVSSDKEMQGVRVLQGDGLVTVKWADIDRLTVLKKDDAARPPRVEIEIALRGGRKVPAAFAQQGAMKLTGKTDLGEYSIDLDKIRAIAPVH